MLIVAQAGISFWATKFDTAFWQLSRPRSFAMATIQLAINGKSYSVEADAETSLLTVLREHLDLTGSKYGCGEG